MLRERGVVGKFVEFYGAGVGRAAARRPRDDRQHVAGVRLDLRDLPDRRRDAQLPRALRAQPRADRAGRGLRQGAGPVARRALRSADLLRHDRARPRARSSRASPGPSAPRTGCRSAAPREPSRHALADYVPDGGRAGRRRTTRRSPSHTRPPTRRPNGAPGHDAARRRAACAARGARRWCARPPPDARRGRGASSSTTATS